MDAARLADGPLHAGGFVVAEWRDGGETSAERPIAPLHVHFSDDEAWYVIEGRLGFVRGDDRVEAAAGSAVLVPRGTPHSFWNAADGETRYVIVMTPRIAALVDAVHAPGSRERLHELFREHDSELLA
ncbi:MAG TPA: cupin domain-containing protein [Gaiellaceae bacterium]|nr:cupin domain-containing protein [Gaiellaceae bacterium]